MRFVELFAGIGGFSLGFERAGMECVGHVEIEPYAQKVLLKHWPDVLLLPDVKKVKGDEFGRVDLLCGGFPCQDISVAGKQGGIHGKRSGLYDEIIRIARVCRPRYIVLENVANLLSRTDWFGYVLGRLAEIGYDAEWQIISARDVGAPHKRDRVWIVAYPNGTRGRLQQESGQELKTTPNSFDNGEKKPLANSGRKSKGAQEIGFSNKPEYSKTEGVGSIKGDRFADSRKIVADPQNWRLQGPFKKHGISQKAGSKVPRSLFESCFVGGKQWEIEPNVGRVANGVPSRTHRLKCLGNALVPQIAEYIGNQIMECEK